MPWFVWVLFAIAIVQALVVIILAIKGNRLTGPSATGTGTYTWDQANRLATANGTNFAYNADGLRTTRTPTTGPSQHYAWDTRADMPLMLTDGSLSYLYDDIGRPVEQIDAAGAALYYQHDQYGSTRLLTNNTGAIAATYNYDANGTLASKTGTADTVLRWNGQQQDTDTGLYYLRARWYDPLTTQFISVDPLAALTQAIYTYANNNPLNSSDPLGLVSLGLCATGSVGFMLGGFAQVCAVITIDDRDGSMTAGFTESVGGGMHTPSAAVVGTVQLSSARNVDQLGGPFAYGGLSAREILSAGAGIFAGNDCDAPGGIVLGAEINLGIGLSGPLPAEVHGGVGTTWTQSSQSLNPWR